MSDDNDFMDDRDGVNVLADDLKRVIDRHLQEFDLTLATVVGVLEVLKLELFILQTQDSE